MRGCLRRWLRRRSSAWAFAMASQHDVPLSANLARAAERRLNYFNAQAATSRPIEDVTSACAAWPQLQRARAAKNIKKKSKPGALADLEPVNHLWSPPNEIHIRQVVMKCE